MLPLPLRRSVRAGATEMHHSSNLPFSVRYPGRCSNWFCSLAIVFVYFTRAGASPPRLRFHAPIRGRCLVYSHTLFSGSQPHTITVPSTLVRLPHFLERPGSLAPLSSTPPGISALPALCTCLRVCSSSLPAVCLRTLDPLA